MSFIYLYQIECRLSWILSQSQSCKAQSRKENPDLLIVWLELSAYKRSKQTLKYFQKSPVISYQWRQQGDQEVKFWGGSHGED